MEHPFFSEETHPQNPSRLHLLDLCEKPTQDLLLPGLLAGGESDSSSTLVEDTTCTTHIH